VLPEQLRVRGYDAGLEEEEADVEAQFSDDEAVSECARCAMLCMLCTHFLRKLRHLICKQHCCRHG
jgi:hypothetical protein